MAAEIRLHKQDGKSSRIASSTLFEERDVPRGLRQKAKGGPLGIPNRNCVLTLQVTVTKLLFYCYIFVMILFGVFWKLHVHVLKQLSSLGAGGGELELKQATECRLVGTFCGALSLSCPFPPSSTFAVQTDLAFCIIAPHACLPAVLPPCWSASQPASLLMANFSYCHHKQVYVLRNVTMHERSEFV